MNDNRPGGDPACITEQVGAFYERHPYPPPVDDLDAYRRLWDEARRRAEFHLLWPAEPFRDDRSILVAGCGASQAAKYAMRWPRAQVVGIDLSAESLAATEALKTRYGLGNLQVRQLPIERAAELGRAFDHIVCTGVLHHLPDPDAGLAALREVMSPNAAAHLMVYAPYGRAGVYLIQDYCRRLGIGASEAGIADLVVTLRALPPDHPLAPLLRKSPDFASAAGLADALLHPQDRSYSVPQLFNFLDKGGLRFGRWLRQAPYLRQCGGGPAQTPHTPHGWPGYPSRSNTPPWNCFAAAWSATPWWRTAATRRRRRPNSAATPGSTTDLSVFPTLSPFSKSCRPAPRQC